MDHPVVHVSLNDAVSYCNWTAGRLSTEAEWKVAANGNGRNSEYPWGDQLIPEGIYHANTWQGKFLVKNTKKDGYFGTAPLSKFYRNEYNIYQMIGNVWEWCLNPARIPLKEFKGKSPIDFLEKNIKHQI